MVKVVGMANNRTETDAPPEKGPVMASEPEFQHIRMSRVKDVVVVEIISKDLQGPAAARELGAELSVVSAQEWAKQLLLNFHRISYLSSTGFAVLFKLVSEYKTKGGQLKICNLDPGIRLGAEIVGLDKLVEIHDTEARALASFAKN
jgi:anti-sigma B factor antagonist